MSQAGPGKEVLHVHHHFDTAEQQYSSSKLGLWLFLVTEVLLFGGLFVAYIMFRAQYPDSFLESHLQLDRTMGAVNTLVLIGSSFTMAMAVGKAKANDPQAAARYCLVTLLCGALFMVIKYFEYSHKFHVGLLPGSFYSFEGIAAPHPEIFFSLYFMMTGLHGIHVLVGMGLIAWVMKGSYNNKYGSAYSTPVELTGLYWHLVDLIWIYLFPLMYLIG